MALPALAGSRVAVSRALPRAVEVADRWYLMENASAAFLGAVRKFMRQILSVHGMAFVDPAPLTAAERLQYQGYLRREEINAAIGAHAEHGATIKEIVRAYLAPGETISKKGALIARYRRSFTACWSRPPQKSLAASVSTPR